MPTDWYTRVEKTVEDQKKNISEKDQSFYHIARFLKAAEKTENFSGTCIECLNNKTIIDKVSETISKDINTPGTGRRKFERHFSLILKHLRKRHGYYPIRYFVSLYSFFGIVIGGLVGLIILLFISNELKWMGFLIGFATGLICGRIIGAKKDNIVKTENRRI